MAHLGTSYTSFETFLSGAQAFYVADLSALNSSGVASRAVLAVRTDADGSRYINVSIDAEGLTPDVAHVQHVHGLFDDDGNPADSNAPTIANDTDRDGMVEVLEGVSAYGDVILSLPGSDGFPVADSEGRMAFIQNYDLDVDANFVSPVTMTQYDADDLMPLEMREIVLHGVEIPDGIGAGTDGEVDGDNGYIPILPAAAGDIEVATLDDALAVLAEQRADASLNTILDETADLFDGGVGDDTIRGNDGDDTLLGGGDRDFIDGGTGNDMLSGGSETDTVYGGAGDDMISGGTAGDFLVGQAGNDVLAGNAGSDVLFGGDGDDFINGGFGNDRINTGAGSDKVYHSGDAGHGTDWIQDFDGDADTLVFGGAADADDFVVSNGVTGSAGSADIAETFITHQSTGQVLWALVDGADLDSLSIQTDSGVFDLLG
ncbi:calcium-binding protein [Palleronia pelagia]|uniref:Hemolysin-type calcium-binding repeat-containing protein n=1 Tax=Palleronia pelagia TaxID=387096 RepID=A0A1H8AL94_9RHOB|nr:calcium-binding protein [Palleronia pelagia]SEM70539.1 Hemolysin-type calcium-binding repeat-containing protein [Palleronia pelagia]